MGLKSYFRKPVNKDVQASDPSTPPSNVFTLKDRTSRTPSSYDLTDPQVVAMHRLNNAKHAVMVNHIWSQQTKLLWYSGGEDEGVVIKSGRDQFVCCPPDLERSDGFFEAIKALNVKVSAFIPHFDPQAEDLLERHDHQHARYPDPTSRQLWDLYPDPRGSSRPDSS